MTARCGCCATPDNGLTMTRRDGFLNGRVQAWQPRQGYRAGMDAVMLAAACPARPGDAVLELGCGAGVASLCLAARVPELRLTGLELQPDYADLARRNADEAGVALSVLTGDLATPPPALHTISFDQVIMNPPYFGPGTPAPDPGRATARHEATPLAQWIDAGLRRLRSGGALTLIQRIDRLTDALTATHGRAGALTILPIAPRPGHQADRFLLLATKGSRAAPRLLAPFTVHRAATHQGDGVDDFSDTARAVLREGAAIGTANSNPRDI